MRKHPLQTADKRLARTDELLRLLREASPQEPSPYIREQLEAMGSLQFSSTPFQRGRQALQHHWLWALPIAALAIVVVVMFLPLRPQVAALDLQVTPPGLPPSPGSNSSNSQVPEISSPVSSTKKSTRVPDAAPPKTKPIDRLTVPLPYSNPDISTGTSTVVRVAMPQVQLAALGLPLPAVAADSRIIADVTLGDDGLPKSISLPLPLQVVKEN
ncbi:hypothetical protein FTW19_07605 [Terriglobus albidus]|uniref:Uncharacterized protein n=1 Tax=Terriglobus albidus TaxID=1592106 RepID=A0A5B9E7X5_9BACT|nr:hypothetical protein [Terriglobus albidus]QEE27869.1 hypothetical protein FTW19_07605 [Terriglobus albidus]